MTLLAGPHLSSPASPRSQRARGGRWRSGAFLLGAILAATTLAAQVPDQAGFEFLGFRPGMSRFALDSAVHRAGADSLRCTLSRSDPSLAECRASLPNADAGRTVDLWLSTMGDSAGILTLAAVLTRSRLDRWREFLVARYGDAPVRVRGPMLMLQWISDRRMLRLTWRVKGRGFDTSVSLIDGRIVDGWGARRTHPR